MIEFWYEFASTYSYPAAMRVQRLADAAAWAKTDASLIVIAR
jgi:hypothetical protein